MKSKMGLKIEGLRKSRQALIAARVGTTCRVLIYMRVNEIHERQRDI